MLRSPTFQCDPAAPPLSAHRNCSLGQRCLERINQLASGLRVRPLKKKKTTIKAKQVINPESTGTPRRLASVSHPFSIFSPGRTGGLSVQPGALSARKREQLRLLPKSQLVI